MRDTLRRRLRVIAAISGVVWDVSHPRAVAFAAVTIIGAASQPVLALLSKLLVDALVGGAGPEAMVIGSGYVLLQLVSMSAFRATRYLTYDLADRVTHRIEERILGVVLGSPGIEHLERADLADQIQTVRNRSYVPMNIIGYVTNTTLLVVALLSSLVLLAAVHPVLLLMPLMVAPLVVARYRLQRREFQGQEAAVRDQRLYHQYLTIATGPATAKEVRVFGLGRLLLDRYAQARRIHVGKLVRARVLHQAGVGALELGQGAVIAGAVAFTVWLALHGRASVGAVVMAVQLIPGAAGDLSAAGRIIAGFAEMMATGERYMAVLDYEPTVRVLGPEQRQPSPARIERGIELRDVSFSYPGTERDVLSGVSLVIPAGTILALVGENGAGKTTLVKLLSRFYDPTSGTILVDGVDLRDIDLEAWRRQSTAVFQDFASYQLIARESIGVGELERIEDVERVLVAARAAGANEVLARLPAGLDTQLGREFDGGVEISAGEGQKIALARGSMPDAPALVVLDEPTASLDARAEHEVFRQFVQMAHPEHGLPPVTVLVSHRFSTVRMADVIAVLHDGRLEEVGSHDQLMRTGGRYSDLFNLQASRYT